MLVVEPPDVGCKEEFAVTAPFAKPGERCLVVTGHPNHELAIFGFTQRVKPRFLFLTDGGGEHRVAESRLGLEKLGLLKGTRFLSTSETTLYEALLDQATDVFTALIAEVRTEIEETGAGHVVCESVEFYNPLHDMTLPIVWAAARGLPGIQIWEFPLIAQLPDTGERYRVQRMAPDRARDVVNIELTPDELATKLDAKTHIYACLRSQLGSVADELDERHLAVEYFARAKAPYREPGEQDCVRYDWRARHLLEKGEIKRVISQSEHVRPMVAALEIDRGVATGS